MDTTPLIQIIIGSTRDQRRGEPIAVEQLRQVEEA
jgi:hypothetical protein